MENQAGSLNTSTDQKSGSSSMSKKFLYCKVISFAVVSLGLVVYCIADYEQVCHLFEQVLEFLQDLGAWGFVVFVVIFILATILLVPAIILTVGAGFIYSSLYGIKLGILIGTLLVFLGAKIGALIAYWIGNSILRNFITNKINQSQKLMALDECIKEKGFQFVFLLRLSPIIPFNIFNYIIGGSSVLFKHYFWANFGILPGTIAYVYLGSVVSSLSTALERDFQQNWVSSSILIVGAVIAVVAVVYISVVAKKRLNAMMKVQREMRPSFQQNNFMTPDTP